MLCNDMIGIIREQRHDFLNHFQVVLGYLQLNKADRAVAYIKQVNLEMQELSNITKLENPYLMVALLLAEQKSKSLGVELSFHLGQRGSFCQEYSESLVDQLLDIIEGILQLLTTVREEDRWLEITLHESVQEIIWVFTGSSILPIRDLSSNLLNPLPNDLLKKRSAKVEESPEQISLIFRFLKNNIKE